MLVTQVNCAKTAEVILMLFAELVQGIMYYIRVQMPPLEQALLRGDVLAVVMTHKCIVRLLP